MKKAKLTKTTTSKRGRVYKQFVVTFYDEDNKRVRKAFFDKKKADAYLRQCNVNLKAKGETENILLQSVGLNDVRKLSSDAIKDAVAAISILNGRASLETAARFYVRELSKRSRDIPTISELIDRFKLEKRSDGLRARSIGDLGYLLSRLCDAYGDRRVDTITRRDLREWLIGLKNKDGTACAKNTRKHFQFAASGLFRYAQELDLIDTNPAVDVINHQRNKVDSTECEILTPGQLKDMLNIACVGFPAMVAPLAIGAFAGCRTAEIHRLTWDDIDFDRDIIKISASIAKKRSVRNVTILPNLKQWLEKARRKNGDIWEYKTSKYSKDTQRIAVAAGLESWPHNALRHSFGSYHLEHFGDPVKTALEMGHRDAGDLLFEHYRQLTTKDKAREWWEIRP